MIPWSRSTSNGSLRGPRSPESGAQFPQIIYSDWGRNLPTRSLSSSAECNYWPILIRDKFVPSPHPHHSSKYLKITFSNNTNVPKYLIWDISQYLLAIPKCEHNETNESNVGRPQQDLHDNKTNCSLESRIQTYFSIHTALLLHWP